VKFPTGASAALARFVELQVSYERLLDVFWDKHDPTTPNRSGNDVGEQYRCALLRSRTQALWRASACVSRLPNFTCARLRQQQSDCLSFHRSGIYYHTEEQKAIAEAALARKNEELGGKVVTEIQQVRGDQCVVVCVHHCLALSGGPFRGHRRSLALIKRDPSL
jgi:peptide methionine sulfoxide reductase MsrA